MKKYVLAAFAALAVTFGVLASPASAASASDMFPPAQGSAQGGSQG